MRGGKPRTGEDTKVRRNVETGPAARTRKVVEQAVEKGLAGRSAIKASSRVGGRWEERTRREKAAPARRPASGHVPVTWGRRSSLAVLETEK